MSIEQVFADLVNAFNAQTKAIQENTAALVALAGASANSANDTASSVKTSAASEDTPAKGKRAPRKTAADKAAEKAAAEAAEKEELEGADDDNLDDDDDLFGDGGEEEAKTYTPDEVKEIMTASVPVIGKPALVALLKKYGAARLTDLSEDNYADFAGELEAQIAAKQAA